MNDAIAQLIYDTLQSINQNLDRIATAAENVQANSEKVSENTTVALTSLSTIAKSLKL